MSFQSLEWVLTHDLNVQILFASWYCSSIGPRSLVTNLFSADWRESAPLVSVHCVALRAMKVVWDSVYHEWLTFETQTWSCVASMPIHGWISSEHISQGYKMTSFLIILIVFRLLRSENSGIYLRFYFWGVDQLDLISFALFLKFQKLESCTT